MKTSPVAGHTQVTRLTSSLFLPLGATLLCACAGESTESVSDSPSPGPGIVEIARPVKLAARARVPEKEPGFVAAEVHDHRISIEHDGGLTAFTVGDVLGGTQGGGYVVRVTGVQIIDTTHVALTTVRAALPELIAEGEFHVHYDAAASRSGADQLFRAPAGDAGGEQIAAHAEALKIAAGGPIRLLDLVHAGLPASCGVGADGALDLDATAVLTPVLDIDVKIGSRGGLNPIPELQRLRVVASGRLDVSASLHGAGTALGRCSIDLLALGGGALSVPLPSLTFWVGPVPVVVTTEVLPRAKATLDVAFTAAELTATARTTTALEVGVDYKDEVWSTIWEPSCQAAGTASVQAPGAITASCEVSAGAELRARLYGVLGPNLGVEAYARAQAEAAAPYCSYDARIDGGVRAYAQAEAGVSVGPLDLSLGRLDLVDLDLVRFQGPRFSGALNDAPECSSTE